MKKITLLVLLFATTISIAQEKEDELQQDVNKHHELKINALSLIGFKWFDASYEYLIDKESSFGVGLLFSLDDDNDIIDIYKTFSITPYYRRYFSNKHAKGFFVEAFGMLNTYENDYYDYYYDNGGNYVSNHNEGKETDFAVGISAGGKFVTKNGFAAEVYLGLGRNLLNSSQHHREIVGRAGISLGYRF